ncbi:MAG: DUF1501 domain-containing protein [Betaproteobacteria bacterium]|nr:DUF1501 domain-containing protein [Betaproteobacteria bacterium]
MNRRQLLQIAAAAPLYSVAGRLFAAGPQNPRLLVVFMRGGYDAANLLVPIASDFYYESRPNIAIARPGAVADAALPLDADWGLHPALRDSIYPLWQRGQVAFVPFAGTEDLTRSHFETQDSIEMGQAATGSHNFASGFLNRLSVALKGGQPIGFTDQLPLILRGEREVPNIALRSLGKPAVDERQSAIIADMYRQTKLAATVSEGFGVRVNVMREMAEEMDAASRGAITAKGFELEARRIAKLMKERFNVGFVDVGGWDTHVSEGGATGYLAGRLEELGRGLAAFADELGPAWSDTVVMVISEFGRTFRENGNRGTDHGHGSVYWVLGGRVAGGRLRGDQVRVTQPTLFQNRDYPVRNEYRSVFGGLFARMYGLSAAQLQTVFADVPARDLGLV